jgi:lipopolysaccharide/colanic/teichoic acid biosynthesis glycosyltransferase
VFDITASAAAAADQRAGDRAVRAAGEARQQGAGLFRQTRVGLYGESFDVIKLRSMRTDAEANGAQWAQKDDPRVTRLGKFIRKVRIDELPQTWSVLKGEMSFVGPRPERPEFVADLEEKLPYYAERHMVKPGITGWAQINYPYGASIEDSRHKLELRPSIYRQEGLHAVPGVRPADPACSRRCCAGLCCGTRARADRLFAVDGRHASMRRFGRCWPHSPLSNCFRLRPDPAGGQLCGLAAGEIGVHNVAVFHLLGTTGGLVLVHNLYGGASSQARLLLRWPAIALAALWIFDLNQYTIGYLSGGTPAILDALRGALGVGAATLLAFGARSGSEALRFRPSRAVAFQSASLLLIGGYLIGMVAVAQSLAYAGGDFAQWTQLAFVAACSVGALVALPSRRARGWLRVTLVKHLFQHRYDYRAEWLRFTRTIGRATRARPLRLRSAPSGRSPISPTARQGCCSPRTRLASLIWRRAGSGRPPMFPPQAFDAATARRFETQRLYRRSRRLARRAARAGVQLRSTRLAARRSARLGGGPLLHFERLVGMVVLARPRSHAGSTGKISTCCVLSVASWPAIWPNTPGRKRSPKRTGSTISIAASLS